MRGNQIGNLKYLEIQLDLLLSLRFQFDYLLTPVHFILAQKLYSLAIMDFFLREEHKI